jgi:hypothetical protein
MTDEIRDRRQRKLEDTIRQAAKELLAISDFAGFAIPLGDGRQIHLGVQVRPEIYFDHEKRCAIVEGKECWTGDELWDTAWDAELSNSTPAGHTVLADRERLQELERLKMNVGPGESFQEDVPWVASFATDEPDTYVHVFAGETLREAIDKAIAGAPKDK